MTDYTLEFLGRTLLEMRSEMRTQNDAIRADLSELREENRARFKELEDTVAQHQDELTVTAAMVMRRASEPIAWGAMQKEIRRLTDRVEALETHDR